MNPGWVFRFSSLILSLNKRNTIAIGAEIPMPIMKLKDIRQIAKSQLKDVSSFFPAQAVEFIPEIE